MGHPLRVEVAASADATLSVVTKLVDVEAVLDNTKRKQTRL